MVTFSWAGATDVGRARRSNQDAVLPDDTGLGPGPVVVAVADGLGGYAGSDVAARLAIEAVASSSPADSGPEELVAAAHRRILDHIDLIADSQPALVDMSTTLTLAVLQPGGLVEIGHVGDSRAYGSDGAGMAQLTTDHTVAMDLVRAGRLSEMEAPGHPGWHTMSNWLGRSHSYWVETRAVVCGLGDRLLLCSDGLSNMLPGPVIYSILHSGTPDEVCSALIAAANDAGGSDNISVVVVSVEL
jgi:PPM family protein phosphatase